MEVDVLIIGQGISGTFLSWNLAKQNVRFVVIDEDKPFTSSKIASGVINPVTGRQVVSTWMIETLLPFCKQAYTTFEQELNASFLTDTSIVSFAHTDQMMQAFEKRVHQEVTYIKADEINNYSAYFNVYGKAYQIVPVYLLDLHVMMQSWRKQLINHDQLLNEYFDINAFSFNETSVQYKHISAKKIIFCNGIQAYEYDFWKTLPYALNKGQALIAEIDGLPGKKIYKFGGTSYVPWDNNTWWIGSTYEREFENDLPTAAFRNHVEAEMKGLLKLPFKVLEHLSAVRPAALERRPFVGFHPLYKNIGILNGMGTKGCSLAPYFSQQLTENITAGKPIDPLADVQRFNKILTTRLKANN